MHKLLLQNISNIQSSPQGSLQYITDDGKDGKHDWHHLTS